MGTSAPWYSLERPDVPVGDGKFDRDDDSDKRGGRKGNERPSLLGAVVVGKAKKPSKKDRRKARKEKLMELRAEREHRERIERERYRKSSNIGS